MTDRPFTTSFNQSPGSDEPGLVLGDDNVVYLIKPDGSRVEVGTGGAGPSCVLTDQTIGTDAHLLGPHLPTWTALWDNQYDQNPLAAIPDGLGMTFAFDGSSPTITTIESGIWALTATLAFYADAAWLGQFGSPFINTSVTASPNLDQDMTLTNVCRLPAGISGHYRIITVAQSTADPFAVYPTVEIVRLA